MTSFRFLHAADLHLDSPLVGLARKSAEQARLVEDASRRAFDAMVDLAVAERCAFVVIAGDLFDGQWRDWRTGLYFAARMRRLDAAGIRVLVVLGNHDADNRFAARLQLAANVHLFSARRPETVEITGLDVAVHGTSFAQREVSDNLAAAYPPPLAGRYNIGVLHTALTGREGHADYAPCSVEQLVNHGYDYWALGHVHAREIVHRDPWIVYPGNLQGRSPRETGDKGVTLVTVADGRTTVEHRALDAVRWAAEAIDVAGAGSRDDVLGLVGERLRALLDAADGRGLALRLRLAGTTALHHVLVADLAGLREDIETLAAGLSEALWIERLTAETAPPASADVVDGTVAGRREAAIAELAADPAFAVRRDAILAELRSKMPAAVRPEAMLAEIAAAAAPRAAALAVAIVRGSEG
ncbi:MAG: DNA repair exonuclease [Alphaproteobacteria bacterium]|nr:DNA repair exonuclease [Alphaproteobacteria bacterium]